MKNLLKLMFAASASIVLLASCSKDTSVIDPDPGPDPDPTPVRVELNINAENYVVRSLDENSISDVNIYFYNKGNGEDYHFYYSDYAPTFVFDILPGTYTLYVVTNVNKNLGDLTNESLLQYEYSIDDMDGSIPMTASTEISVLGATAIPAIQVKRVAAKISYSVTVDDAVASEIKLKSVQFMNVPKSTTLFGTSATSTDKNKFFDDKTVETKNTKSYSDTYYQFENCQGEVSSITDQKDKSPKNAPECASYMRIIAESPGKYLEYIIYLGENATSNFDVRRNTKHTMNLIIKGENEIDNRVKVYNGLYYGTANSHICSGAQITFDAQPYRTGYSRNYAYTGLYAGKEYEAASADLLWQDVIGLVSRVSFKDNKVTVSVDRSKGNGNALIALYDSDKNIVWSFHIWATEQPELLYLYESSKNPNNKYVMMDRALGAKEPRIDILAPDGTGRGLVYQFGRKDPFPSFDWSIMAAGYGYDMSGKKLYIVSVKYRQYEDVQFGHVGSIEYAIANPTIYIGTYDSGKGWVYPYDYEAHAGLWGNPLPDLDKMYPDNSAIKKSVYDPCPNGYKVSPNDGFDQIDISTYKRYKDINGEFHTFADDETIGRGRSGSTHQSVGAKGSWGSGLVKDNADYYAYSTTFELLSFEGKKVDPLEARSVRCVKE